MVLYLTDDPHIKGENYMGNNKVLKTAIILIPIMLLAACAAQPQASSAEPEPDEPVVNTDSQSSSETLVGKPTTEAAGSMRSVVENAAWGSNVHLDFEADTFIVHSNGIPNHAYLDLYLFPPDVTQPVSLQEQDYEYTFPLEPVLDSRTTKTPFGPIGIAISGALYFNPFEGDGTTYAYEERDVTSGGLVFVDDCFGHPNPQAGQYHYHGIALCIAAAVDIPGQHSGLAGYLFDGFPIYGPQDVNGSEPTDLDSCNGHFGSTPEFPDGIYNYHTTTFRPYVPECFSGVVEQSNLQSGPGAEAAIGTEEPFGTVPPPGGSPPPPGGSPPPPDGGGPAPGGGGKGPGGGGPGVPVEDDATINC